MKKIILAALFCALAAAAGAQNTVLSIRKEYQEVHEWMQRMTPDEEMVKFDIYGNTWVHPCAPDVRLNPSVSSITSAVKVLISL